SMLLLTAGASLAGMLSPKGSYGQAAALSVAALGGGLLVSASVSVETLLIIWFVSTPLAPFYIRFPTDRSIVTYNRTVFALIAVLLLTKWLRNSAKPEANASLRQQTAHIRVSKFEVAWALLSVLAIASALSVSNDPAPAIRTAVDTFFLPLVAFHVG